MHGTWSMVKPPKWTVQWLGPQTVSNGLVLRLCPGLFFFLEKNWKYPEKSGRNGNFRIKLEHTVAFEIFRQVSGL